MYTIKPANGRIVCIPMEVAEETKSGFLLAPAAAGGPTPPAIAVVVNAPNEDYAVGQKLLYAPFTVNEVSLDRTKYLILKPEDVLGIVEEVKSRSKGATELAKIKAKATVQL